MPESESELYANVQLARTPSVEPRMTILDHRGPVRRGERGVTNKHARHNQTIARPPPRPDRRAAAAGGRTTALPGAGGGAVRSAAAGGRLPAAARARNVAVTRIVPTAEELTTGHSFTAKVKLPPSARTTMRPHATNNETRKLHDCTRPVAWAVLLVTLLAAGVAAAAWFNLAQCAIAVGPSAFAITTVQASHSAFTSGARTTRKPRMNT